MKRFSWLFIVTLVFSLQQTSAEAHGLTQQMPRLLGQKLMADAAKAFQLRQLHLGKTRIHADTNTDGVQDTATEGKFAQLIDHSNASDTRTFDQRYFYNGSYASGPNAPVLFYICGEATCSSGDLSGATAAYAKQLGAHRIALEHRYYGYSQPFPTLSTQNMKYLTTDNALEDLAAFQRWAQKEFKLTGPWIAIGGSYPGALSAFYRARYPELVVGSLASSAPVEAKENFQEYDLAVNNAAGPACAGKMRDTVKVLEAALANPEELAKYKAMFDASEVDDPVEFLYVVADMGAIAIQYGFQTSFCNALVNATDPISAYAEQGKQLFAMFGLTAVMDTAQGAMSEDPNDYISPWGMRQWLYQSCTEYGFWQVAYEDPAKSTRSHLIDLKYHHGLCAKVFGIPIVAQPERLNNALYNPMRGEKSPINSILFLNGGNDPWKELSITTERSNSLNPGLGLYTIAGSAHCGDLASPSPGDSPALANAHALTMTSFKRWLGKAEELTQP